MDAITLVILSMIKVDPQQPTFIPQNGNSWNIWSDKVRPYSSIIDQKIAILECEEADTTLDISKICGWWFIEFILKLDTPHHMYSQHGNSYLTV